ncbi:MAG TPA: hypothetical protein VGO55_10010 [Allosphingosinicella sp.]|jgi:hypothetical protein|nr:hypothetical protein [Allosphingosinicella sp.]
MVRGPAIQIACALLIGMGSAQAALGQPRPRPAPAPARAPPAAANLPVPDRLTSLKMLWSMMAAVDHANRTGNYSVLRDLGSAAFQSRNNPANLAAIFAGLRERNVDLADTLVVTPNWEIAPTIIQPQVLRMRGSFPLRPEAIAFDLLFTWDGGWRLDAIAVQALPGAR